MLDNKEFLYHGNSTQVNEIPPGTYLFKAASMPLPARLVPTNDLSLPSKIYGDIHYFSDIVLDTFHKTQRNLGVLLEGIKGSGKSVQIKDIVNRSGMPAIIVDSYVDGSELLEFLNKTPTSCVIIFDEFDKVFRKLEAQEKLLPLLDGLSVQPHIYCFSCNYKDTLIDQLVGRPSRIRYCKNYTELPPEAVLEILENNNVDKESSELIMSMDVSTIDTVLALVEEYQISSGSFRNRLEFFNMDSVQDKSAIFETDIPMIIKIPLDLNIDIQCSLRDWFLNRDMFMEELGFSKSKGCTVENVTLMWRGKVNQIIAAIEGGVHLECRRSIASSVYLRLPSISIKKVMRKTYDVFSDDINIGCLTVQDPIRRYDYVL